MIGATITPTGTPAFASASTARSRSCGGDARGSITRRISVVEARDRDVHHRGVVLGELAQQIDVARHEAALRDDRARVAVLREHLEAARA